MENNLTQDDLRKIRTTVNQRMIYRFVSIGTVFLAISLILLLIFLND